MADDLECHFGRADCVKTRSTAGCEVMPDTTVTQD